VSRTKFLLSSGDKRKIDRDLEECRKMKGKWKLKSVDDNQPLMSKGKSSGRYSFTLKLMKTRGKEFS